MKIGIYGGTFDPVHKGHVVAAKSIREEFGLDKVVFIPTGNPMHKIFSRVVPGKMRVKMLELAISGEEGLAVSDIEIARKGYTYTIDTLRELAKNGDELYYLVGTDVLGTMDNWKDFDEIVKLCNFIAMKRPGYDEEDFQTALYRVQNSGANVLVSTAKTFVEASSSDVRRLAAEGNEELKEIVPEAVAEYIFEHKLYDESRPVPEEQILLNLQELLSEEKFQHSLGVSKEAVRLAEIYGADVEKCRLAGLLHDCAKNVTPDQLSKWFGMQISDFGNGEEFCGVNRRVIHGPVGKLVAERRFGIKDKTVLEAIANHVTGKPGMSLEAAIVFISDYTENNRDGAFFDEIREVLETKGIYAAIVRACDKTTEIVQRRGEMMDVQMVYTRNWAISRLES